MASDKTFCDLILATLGGSKFAAMVGTGSIVYGTREVKISFKAKATNRANILRVIYDAASDLLSVEFARYTARNFKYETLAVYESVCIADLVSVFETETGLRTRLF